jgi:hypothetical protein
MKKVKRMFVTLLMCGLMVGLFTVAAFAASEVEENDSFDTAQSVLVNDFVTGNLATSGDVDYYRFTVPSDGYISLTFNHDYVDSGNTYWYVTLYNTDKSELVQYSFAGNSTKNDCNSIGVPAGTYYAKVSKYYHSDVSYELKLNYTQSGAWETELNDSFDTADLISANSSINGSLMTSGDVDYYKITVPSNGYISLTFNHDYVDSGWDYWYVTLYNTDKRELVQYSFVGNSTKNDCNSIGVPAGTYYAKVSKYYHSDVSYELKLNYTQSGAWETEFNDSFDTADLISANTSIKGSLMTSSDVDYYKITVPSDGYISLTFNHNYVDSGWDYWYVTLYNTDKSEFVQYGFAGNTTKNDCDSIGVPAGTYYAKVSKYYHSDVSYELKLNYTQSGAWETELNDSFDTADPISANKFISGNLMTSSDVDYYKISLSSAGNISLIFNHDYVDSGWDYWYVTLYNESIQEIVKYSFSGNQTENECESMRVLAGTYYIKVTKYYYSDGEYKLMISNGMSSVPVSGVRINKTSATLKVGETIDLTATVLPADASDPSVSWKSSDPSVATVSSSGKVSAVAAGTATITVTTSDGGYTAKCTVTVEERPAQSAADFQDVSAGAYYYDAVQWAVEQKITEGTSATTFSPLKSCTRAEVVTFLWRAAGAPKPVSSQNPFTDVKSSNWYYDAVLWAVEQGITDGTSATTFSPSKYCTRAEVVTFLWRANGKPEVSADVAKFSDVSVGRYYSEPVAWAVEHGITDGMGSGRFAPMSTCNRAQVVTFLYRYAVNG